MLLLLGLQSHCLLVRQILIVHHSYVVQQPVNLPWSAIEFLNHLNRVVEANIPCYPKHNMKF